MSDLKSAAQRVADAGRNGDSVLVHMTPEEVADLSRMGIAAGIGPVGINPDTGMPEASFFGDLLKGIGAVVPGVLGTAFGGPLVGALASGLFTGITEDSLKKGLLSGLGSFALGKGLTSAINQAGRVVKGVPGITQMVSTPPTPRGLDFLKAIPGALTSEAGLKAAGDELLSDRMVQFAYPAMREIDLSIQQDRLRRQGIGGYDYDEALADEMARIERLSGRNPYANLYASQIQRYMQGGRVSSRAAGDVGPGMDYNRFQAGGAVPFDPLGGRMVNYMYDPNWDAREPWSERPDWTQDDPRYDENYDDGRTAVPRDGGGGNVPPVGIPFTPFQSWTPPQGYVPGFMPEFMYLSPNRPQNPMEVMNEPRGANPFTFNPFSGVQAASQFGGQFNPYAMTASRFSGFNPFMGAFGMPFGGFRQGSMGAMPFHGPMANFGSPMGGFGGFGMGGFGMPFRGFAEGGAVNPDGGMGDGIPAVIAGPDGTTEPALLSPGEFVIPADVVSMIGDGDTEEGAEELYRMMERIRVRKTGTPDQLPPMDPNDMVG